MTVNQKFELVPRRVTREPLIPLLESIPCSYRYSVTLQPRSLGFGQLTPDKFADIAFLLNSLGEALESSVMYVLFKSFRQEAVQVALKETFTHFKKHTVALLSLKENA